MLSSKTSSSHNDIGHVPAPVVGQMGGPAGVHGTVDSKTSARKLEAVKVEEEVVDGQMNMVVGEMMLSHGFNELLDGVDQSILSSGRVSKVVARKQGENIVHAQVQLVLELGHVGVSLGGGLSVGRRASTDGRLNVDGRLSDGEGNDVGGRVGVGGRLSIDGAVDVGGKSLGGGLSVGDRVGVGGRSHGNGFCWQD